MTAAGTHVVFGTGPAGRAVADALLDQGTRVRMVNRTGAPVLTGVETIGGDATDVDFARDVAADADTVYFCLNAPNYHRWAEEFPPLQRAVLGAAKSADAKLVVLENLYMYGPSTGPLRETTPVNPTSAKSRTRAAMSAELLDAHQRGEVRVVIGRASDFVGPGVRDSALGQFVFQPALAGKRAQTMGRPDTQHTYSYVPDVGRNLVLLGSRDDAYGQVWHLPNPETRTTRHIIIDVYAAAGQRRTDVTALKRPMLRALGLFNRNVRELLHTYYQFAAPFVVDDSAFRRRVRRPHDALGRHRRQHRRLVPRPRRTTRVLHRSRRGHNLGGGRMMSSLASLVVRRRRAVITIWVVLLIGAGTIGSSAFSVLSSSFGAGPSTESGRVTERLDDLAETGGEIAIIADGIDIDDPAVAASLAAGLERVAAIDGVIAVADPWSTGSDALRASDGRAALAVVTVTGGLDEEAEIELAHQITDVARDLDAPEVLVGGNVLVGEQFGTASENDLLRGEAIALPIAFLAMIFLLGGLRAAGMPMLVALAGVITSLAVLVAATMLGDVSIFSINVVNMLGIGLGIDYGLLMVSRFREERGRGRELHDAVIQTVATAGKTVVFSALTVAVAMCGLFVFGLPILTSFGIAGLGVVLLCMAAAVTLLPATLAAVGGRIPPTAPVADVAGRFYRLTRSVQSHALAVGAAAVAVLILLGVPFLDARFEIGDARTLPRSSEVRDVALTLADRFPARGTDPVTVIADTERRQRRVRRLVRAALDNARRRRHLHPARHTARPHRRRRHARRDLTGSRSIRTRRPASRHTANLRHRSRRHRRRAHRHQSQAQRTPPVGRPPRRRRHTRAAVPHDRLDHRADQGRRHEHPQPLRQLRSPGLDLPARTPRRVLRLRLRRRPRPVDAGAHPHLRLRALDGLRGLPALTHQRSARRDRRQ